MNYSGKIELLGKKYNYVLREYEMIIIDSRYDLLRNKRITEIFNNWIETEVNEEKKLIVKLSYKNTKDESVIMNVDAYFYIVDITFKREKMNDEIHKLTYRSEVLDHFFRPSKDYIKMVSGVIQSFDHIKLKRKRIKEYNFFYNNKKFVLYFGINCYLKTDNRFMFDVFNSLNVECEDNITFEEVYEITKIIKKFLSLISNSRKVYFDEISINLDYKDHMCKYGYYYLNQGNKEELNYFRILNYEDIKDNIQEIMQEIISDNICFISLFQYENFYINSIDIMNICAAFESQFDRTYPNYRNTSFINVKNDVLNRLMEIKKEYKKNKRSQEILEEIINSVANYKDVLKEKLEYALADFEKLYAVEKNNMSIQFDFKNSYKKMPYRIKTARNKLDHGNTDVQIGYEVLTDTLILRAIVYFMILKKAGVSKRNIMKCVRRFTKFGI